MSNEQIRQELAGTVDRIGGIDSAKLLRENLGDESLERDFAEDLDKIKELAAFVTQDAAIVHNNHVRQAIGTLNEIAGQMEAQANRPSAEYINHRTYFLEAIRGQLENAREWLPLFAGAAVLERGFLEDEGIRREYERVVEDLKKETAATLSRVKEQADEAVAEAQKLAEEIEARARKSATKMSVEAAQQQFSEATEELQKKVRVWASLAVGSVAILLSLPVVFMYWPLPDGDNWSVALYHTLLRIFMLSAAGAAVTVCVRLFRAHLHMVEKNPASCEGREQHRELRQLCTRASTERPVAGKVCRGGYRLRRPRHYQERTGRTAIGHCVWRSRRENPGGLASWRHFVDTLELTCEHTRRWQWLGGVES